MMEETLGQEKGRAPEAEYVFPCSVPEAVRLLQEREGRARIIAGGTDVLPDIRQHKIRPQCLVDITRIPGLDRIRVMDEYIEIGAAVTLAAIKSDPFLTENADALVEAARSVGALAIQNAATWVGNIVQAMPAADGAIIAIALDAEAHLVDSEDARWVAVESLFQGPGISKVDPTRQFITHLRFPRPVAPWGTAWRRIGRRPSLVLPILNCAVTLELTPTGDGIAHATIALGPVAPRPLRARRAEQFLRGKALDEGSFREAACLSQGEANPRDSVMRASRAYRLAIIPTLVREGLQMAAERAQQDLCPSLRKKEWT